MNTKPGIVFRADSHAKWLLSDGVMEELVKEQAQLIEWAREAQQSLDSFKTDVFYAPYVSVAVASGRGRPKDYEGNYHLLVPHRKDGDPYIQWECSNIHRVDMKGDLLVWIVADLILEGPASVKKEESK